MVEMSRAETAIYNEGERLIPVISHDITETIRHKSSYLFFYKIIRDDLLRMGHKPEDEPIRIIDLGCGVGYGCHMLSMLPYTLVTGVDISSETLEYAHRFYSRPNITYQMADLRTFITEMGEYDYVISRGVIEHVSDGLRLVAQSHWRKRLMIDVPYDEPSGRNPHHVLHQIRENDFADFPEPELLYEDLEGVIYDASGKPYAPNMIMCMCSRPDLPRIEHSFVFPIPAWKPPTNVRWVAADKLMTEAAGLIHPVDVVLDIGPGIRPQNFFEAKQHILCEPYQEYVDFLKQRFQDTHRFIIVPQVAQVVLKDMPSKSVDSIFLIDVIEHLEKADGLLLLAECERVSREQVIVFTPLGFMEQDYQPGDADGWGLHGGEWQKHRSGWIPEDFGDRWKILACRHFHFINGKGEPFDPPFGALWAILNVRLMPNIYAQQFTSALPVPDESRPAWMDVLNQLLGAVDQQLRSVVSSEITDLGYVERELNQTRQELNQTRQELNQTRQELNQTRQELNQTRQELSQQIDGLNQRFAAQFTQMQEQQTALKEEFNRLSWLGVIRAERKLRRILKRNY